MRKGIKCALAAGYAIAVVLLLLFRFDANATRAAARAQEDGGIHLPGTQPGELTVPFQPPALCARCHGEYAEYAAHDQWQGTMMANSFRDPLFRAALAIANQDVPVGGDFCLRCHAPVGWLAGQSLPGDGSRIGPAGAEGVSCEFCHRLEARSLVGNAQYFVVNQPIEWGPYPEHPSGNLMLISTGRRPVFSEHVTRSELCATCHDVTNPLNQLPIESTYTEWQNSAFATEGKECQDCHMPEYPGGGFAAQDQRVTTPFREHLPQHLFVGGNAWIPLALAELHPELNRRTAYEQTARSAAGLLREAAQVELEMQTGQQSDELLARVTVTNLSGHKLPTGYPEGRRMWLHLIARDQTGRIIFESGRYDETEARLIEDPQLKVYEAKLGIAGRGETFHFILNDALVKDNRIPPRGYVPIERTQPVGAEYAPGQHWGVTNYRIPLTAAQGRLTVTAQLFYQTASREYIEFLREQNHSDEWGQRLFDLWQRTGKSTPVLMASASKTYGSKRDQGSGIRDQGSGIRDQQ
jgi:hypothetical protein